MAGVKPNYSKPAKTAADYMAIAACPALIMLLVGSLVFFLLQISYAGEWIGRLRWTLFWFVFAMVLVSRIAIQQNQGAAFLYGLILAGATSLLLLQYIGFIWIVWLLLAIVWWVSNKIVWDCTFIDDNQDASGQGLLQVSQLDRWRRPRRGQVRAVSSEVSNPNTLPLANPFDAHSNKNTDTTFLTPLTSYRAPLSPIRTPQSAVRTRSSPPNSPPRTPHSPGLWVLYFSFAAVPIFGLGELLLNADDSPGRQFGFVLSLIYLAAALMLLLLTSFLGLRRYLRQRYLAMPGVIARQWVNTGVTVALAVLLLALFLPRPTTPYSNTVWFQKLESPLQKSSKYAPQSSDGAQGKSRTQNSSEKVRDPGDNSSAKSTARAPDSEPQSGPQQKTIQSSGSKARSQPSMEPPAPMPIRLEKWVSYLIAAIVLTVGVYYFWPQISDLLRSLMELLSGLFGGVSIRSKKRRVRMPVEKHGGGSHPIRLLPDPFQDGQAGVMSLPDLVKYSFEGMTLWAEARGFSFDSSETPLEFAERLGQREPSVGNEALLLSSYYSHVAYAAQTPPEECRIVLQRLWSIIGFGKGTISSPR